MNSAKTSYLFCQFSCLSWVCKISAIVVLQMAKFYQFFGSFHFYMYTNNFESLKTEKKNHKSLKVINPQQQVFKYEFSVAPFLGVSS